MSVEWGHRFHKASEYDQGQGGTAWIIVGGGGTGVLVGVLVGKPTKFSDVLILMTTAPLNFLIFSY